jgi:aryl-alcohol dehydrogenase-like predicted oxidoreductase
VTEQVVGRALAADRNDWVLATKFGNPLGEGPNRAGTSRKWIIESVENSLRRLGTDYIDLLYFHRADFDAPLGEAVRAIGDLIRAGKLRYFGLSNFRGWRIAEVAHLADAEGIDRPIASQPLYNIVNRTAEAEQLPAAAAYGLGVVSYSPLARGVLTAKYPSLEAADPGSRAARKDKRLLETEWRPESIDIAAEIKQHTDARHQHRRFCSGLGAQQPPDHLCDCRPPHSRAVGRLYPRSELPVHCRGRSPGQPPGSCRPSFNTGLHRPRSPCGRPHSLRCRRISRQTPLQAPS